MPKVNHRCKRRVGGHLIGAPASRVAFSAPPRKVSFEDGHQESSSECSSQSSSPCASPVLTALAEPVRPLMEPMKPLTRKSTLFRPKSSLSLVDLAKPVEEGNNNSNSLDSSGSAPVSPVSAKRSLQTMVESGLPQSPKTPGSPWGHFVDMVIPEEDDTMPSSRHYHDAPCSCCTSCRRRRASPYEYVARNKRPRSVCFIPDMSDSFLSPPSPRGFVLSQRQEPADHLVGALDRLHVNESSATHPLRF